jgi:hypothetical protein
MADIAIALRSLRPTARFSVADTTITWHSEDVTQPTEAEIATEVTRLQDEYDNAQYARDRATAYPPMADQLDDIFHNGVAGWKKTIQAVKDTYPKP